LTSESHTSASSDEPPRTETVQPAIRVRRRAGDPRFHELLKIIGDLHDKKQEDYGTDDDPFANVRASERWGVPAWVGAMVRLHDKVHRLQRFAKRGMLANESAKDSMLDIAVYSLMALILYEEAEGKR
jgi:hypothetical protein